MEERTVKKNMMRLIAMLLTLVLLMGTLISFAETAEETSGENRQVLRMKTSETAYFQMNRYFIFLSPL